MGNRGVTPRGVVCTGVEHNSRPRLGRSERLRKRLKVEGSRLVVRDLLDGETDVLEELIVVGPIRVGYVEGVECALDIPEGEARKEEGARSGKALAGRNLGGGLALHTLV